MEVPISYATNNHIFENSQHTLFTLATQRGGRGNGDFANIGVRRVRGLMCVCGWTV